MKILKQNIINIYGEKGKNWLANLPHIIDELAAHWRLHHIILVNNVTFHYVAQAIASDKQAVILKIGCNEKVVAHEIKALKYFAGNGSVQLIAHHSAHHALCIFPY